MLKELQELNLKHDELRATLARKASEAAASAKKEAARLGLDDDAASGGSDPEPLSPGDLAAQVERLRALRAARAALTVQMRTEAALQEAIKIERGKVVASWHQLEPLVLKALGFNSLKVQCFQAIGFTLQPAPLQRGISGVEEGAEGLFEKLEAATASLRAAAQGHSAVGRCKAVWVVKKRPPGSTAPRRPRLQALVSSAGSLHPYAAGGQEPRIAASTAGRLRSTAVRWCRLTSG